MSVNRSIRTPAGRLVAPLLQQHGREVQAYGTVSALPIALGEEVRLASVEELNQLLADTMVLRDLNRCGSSPSTWWRHLSSATTPDAAELP